MQRPAQHGKSNIFPALGNNAYHDESWYEAMGKMVVKKHPIGNNIHRRRAKLIGTCK